MRRKYTSLRGGHAPGHLREAFLELTDWRNPWKKIAEIWKEDGSVAFDFEESPIPIRRVLTRLWNCTDTIPWLACADLEIPLGSSYAQAVRKIVDYCKRYRPAQ